MSEKKKALSVEGQFLVMFKGSFVQDVFLITEQSFNEQLTYGFCLSRDAKYLSPFELASFDYCHPKARKIDAPVRWGGAFSFDDPVQVLHTPDYIGPFTSRVSKSLFYSPSKDVLSGLVTKGESPAKLLPILGYSLWETDRLNEVLFHQHGMILPFTSDWISALFAQDKKEVITLASRKCAACAGRPYAHVGLCSPRPH